MLQDLMQLHLIIFFLIISVCSRTLVSRLIVCKPIYGMHEMLTLQYFATLSTTEIEV